MDSFLPLSRDFRRQVFDEFNPLSSSHVLPSNLSQFYVFEKPLICIYEKKRMFTVVLSYAVNLATFAKFPIFSSFSLS